MNSNHFTLILSCLACFVAAAFAQESTNKNKFRQLHTELRTPNVYRTASGAPGHAYWQQRADYDMKIELDDANQRVLGSETITYTNNSPDALTYLWLQLDQNMRAQDSDRRKIATSKITKKMSFAEVKRLHYDFDGGFKLEYVRDGANRDLPHIVNQTMMRVDLKSPLKPGGSFVVKVKWWYSINDRKKVRGRSGFEYFPDEGNYLYTIAQFFPRMAVYNEVEGWQHKQFLGRGEFTLPFGNYRVSLTVPADHVVAASGVLQNPGAVLTAAQRSRLKQARTASEPVFIVNAEEALKNEASHANGKKTWVFKADNVRDFAFATSRKFIWDAMGVKFNNRTVMAMSLYPKEGNPLWEHYSTKVVAHTLRTYSDFTFDYPYPVAWSIHSDRIGMEYPMICFNGGRPQADGTYNEKTKYGMISVIIHEVGHNFFPMIVNSDERQWTWMDEGLNTFLQYLTEQQWDRDYPSRRGPADKIVDYMKGDRKNISPIMTNSESLLQFGNNGYSKPAAALNILRETVMGRELFDFAFKQYAQRWMFKHPTPDDLFRTMEDASAVDLDWFWRGWFYSTDAVDLAIDNVRWFRIDSRNPDIEKPAKQVLAASLPEQISKRRNKELIDETLLEKDPSLIDFYNEHDPYEISILDKEEYREYYQALSEEERSLLDSDFNYYEIDFSNKGGLVMPLILEFEYADGSREVERIPAEIWRLNNKKISKIFSSKQKIVKVTLDPFLETADVDVNNNYWPARHIPTRFQLYKKKQKRLENKMQRQKRADEMLETTNGAPPAGEMGKGNQR